jgi:hypothetical protein
MNDSLKEKLIEKIRKLLALAGSSNEHEAALAAEKAQAMLAEYNLSLADIDDDKESDDFVIDKELENDSFPWKRQVAVMVAKLYFCTYFFTQFKRFVNQRIVRLDRHNFVGAQHNIAVTKAMFVYLVATVERLAQEGGRQVPSSEREAYRRAFMWACTHRLSRRIAERIAAARAGMGIKTESGNTLPALANLYDQAEQSLKNFLDGNVGKLKTAKRGGKISSAQGAEDGRAAGDRIGLDTQLTGKAAAHLLR